MTSSFYNVGLQHVGAYQVSGRPWLKWYSASAGEIKLFEFPNVTSKINIQNLTAGQDLQVAFAEPRRALNFIGSPTTYYTSDLSSLALSEATISIWLNVETISTTRVFELKHSTSSSTRMQIHSISPDEIRFFVDNTPVITTAPFNFSNNEWVNIVSTIKTGESKLFINGQQIGNTNLRAFTSTLNTLNLGADTINFDGVYDNVAIFSRELTSTEILELYNNGSFKDPRTSSASSDIAGFWDFEDNQYKTFYSTPDSLSLIKDRVSGNDLSIVGLTSDVEFVDGQLIQNAFDRHKVTLSGESEIELGCKTKRILLKAVGALDFNIKASLTNIPASRMYELTGPGIDD